MRVQLAQQAREILGQSDLVIITERVDDVALLIGQMVKMGLPEVLDRHIPRHWTQRGLSWGWTAVIWLASMRAGRCWGKPQNSAKMTCTDF
jgi:transposase